ncbi:hypothetical protein [Bifidobacterium vespertilionis]|uniref:Glycosyltransferase n=1 Tax=Bifidobacterium vespertilionis TaxID=2562524 RepID=A0A5J5DXK9_9BIFI|nr:hypothetical protein [Bifidobacterium vespertilionis]KAA8819010.1 hypothetical protein EMO90_08620 [Bifidobacterium vespertilionis]KAA8821452.1 hypothetical protein EM848_10865 [Bifidobacterium vespertilionis]
MPSALTPLLVALVLELLVFNLPHWASLAFPGEQAVAVSPGPGLTVSGTRYTVTDPEEAWLDLAPATPADARNTALDLAPVDAPSSPLSVGQSFRFTVSVLDGGHAVYPVDMGEAVISERLGASHYVRLHAAGRVSLIRLTLRDAQAGQVLDARGARLNARVPFHASPLRLSCLLAAAYLVWLFLPSRRMYSWRLDLGEPRQRIGLAGFLIVQGLALVLVSQLIRPARMYEGTYATGDGGAFLNDENQYAHLADALIAGRAWLDIPAPDWLAQVANPYDPGERVRAVLAGGEPALWDYAYWDGRYYSYFGPLPALVLYAPYRLLTGRGLRTDVAVALLALGFLASCVYCLYWLLRLYAPRASFGLYLLSLLALVSGSGAITQVFVPKVYSVPVLASMLLTMLGLGMWLKAAAGGVGEGLPARAPAGPSRSRPSRVLLAGGALCVGLNLLCRPQFVLAVLLAPPVLGPRILAPGPGTRPRDARPRRMVVRRMVGDVLCLLAPLAACGLASMWWNRTRFGSPFDFGALYQLTGFDMTRADHSPVRVIWGLWYYLLQPFQIAADYPFTLVLDKPDGFVGLMPFEPYYAGLFALAPVSLLAVLPASRRVRARLHATGRLSLVLCLLGLGLANLAVDSIVGGISMRYTADFAWTLLLAAILTACTLAPGADGNGTGLAKPERAASRGGHDRPPGRAGRAIAGRRDGPCRPPAPRARAPGPAGPGGGRGVVLEPAGAGPLPRPRGHQPQPVLDHPIMATIHAISPKQHAKKEGARTPMRECAPPPFVFQESLRPRPSGSPRITGP